MHKKHRALFLSILAIFCVLSFSLPVKYTEARSGCCSHHGGVVGCSCGDGTPLSAKCAPYYPSCNNSSEANRKESQEQDEQAGNSWVQLVIVFISGAVVGSLTTSYMSYRKNMSVEEPSLVENIQKKYCPDCGSELELKHGKYGSFYGCSKWPTCSHTENLD